MRKLITMGLIAAAAMPAMASAQSQRELQRDRQDIREEQRELSRARQSGDRGDIRDERGDLRDARREYREDFNDRNYRWGANDWRNYRTYNRNLYARGNFRAPFRYTRFAIGGRIAPSFFGSAYWIRDPWRYRLPAAGRNLRWIRHYNDVLLVNYRTGRVVQVQRGFYL